MTERGGDASRPLILRRGSARAAPRTPNTGYAKVSSRERGDRTIPSGCPTAAGVDHVRGDIQGLDWWVLFVEGVGLLVGVGGVEDGGLVEVAA